MLAGEPMYPRTKDFGLTVFRTSHTVNYLNEAFENDFKSNVPGTLTVVDAKGKNLTETNTNKLLTQTGKLPSQIW